jgi:hypothetical protein
LNNSYFIFHCQVTCPPPESTPGLRTARNPETTEQGNRQIRTPEQLPWSSYHHCKTVSTAPYQRHRQHTPTRSACSASEQAASWTCSRCTRGAARSSWSSWPSCGRWAWSDHHNRSAFGRNDAYPGRTERPVHCASASASPAPDLRGCIHLARLVLGDLVLGVLPAVPGLAVRPAGFRNVDLHAGSASVLHMCAAALLLRIGEYCGSREVRVSLSGIDAVDARLGGSRCPVARCDFSLPRLGHINPSSSSSPQLVTATTFTMIDTLTHNRSDPTSTRFQSTIFSDPGAAGGAKSRRGNLTILTDLAGSRVGRSKVGWTERIERPEVVCGRPRLGPRPRA